MSASVKPVLRLADDKVEALRPFERFKCEWCDTMVERYQATESFRGTEMHRLCVAEAKIAQLEITLTEAMMQLRRYEKRISYLEGATPA